MKLHHELVEFMEACECKKFVSWCETCVEWAERNGAEGTIQTDEKGRYFVRSKMHDSEGGFFADSYKPKNLKKYEEDQSLFLEDIKADLTKSVVQARKDRIAAFSRREAAARVA